MLLQLSEATVGVATNQETPSPATILTWMDGTVWFSTDIPNGINDLGNGTIIYSVQSSEWVPEVIVFRDWLSRLSGRLDCAKCWFRQQV